MTEDRKVQIARGLVKYIEDHKDAGMSQNKVATVCGMSAATISHIIAGKWNAVPAQGGTRTTTVTDAIFLKIEAALGLTADFFETDNYAAIFGACMDAKVRKEWRIIDGLTGAGKSFAVERFARTQPRETFLIRCKNTMNAKEFMQAIARAVGACEVGTRHRICQSIADRLLTMTHPLLIIDESEALFKRTSEGGFGAIKDICDEVKGRVGIVLVGANDFLEQLRLRAMNLRSCFPQLVSRFATAPVALEVLSRADVELIAPAFGVQAKKEMDRLYDGAANFRELFDALRRQQADQYLLKAA
ncbi:DNA transposition protein, AAA+ family ATPase [Hymenobacter daecheongensis DSM 21074]|uniref:DNA transposition protein, AAA+ family ATPase n=1 Tax=Hymenobacter daecheongensis DSM 21074 TaxID=1121955 RepID=A0A1M6LVF4_9BACT|nr:AAA family ATPase [Hymenobacter daecheongensis]SHJ75164.1 DNA transposition protein, AAA+ family ATPase [Hymenobacter daecheongensis DSM 21074]